LREDTVVPTSTYPGVYIREIPSCVRSITGVSTSTAAFVGWASRGPTDRAALIASWLDFTTQFGGLDPRSYLGYAVNQFFLNGGQLAYIVRLVSDGSGGNAAALPAAVRITGLRFDSSAAPAPTQVAITTAGNGGLSLAALNAGSWGDRYSVQIQPNHADYTRFDLSVLFTDSSTQTKSVVETFPNLSPNAGDPHSRYVVTIINQQSAILTAAMGSPALSIANVPSVPGPPLPPPGTASVALAGGNDGTVLNPAATPGPGQFEAVLNVAGSTTGVHLLDKVPFNLLAVPGEADPPTIAELQAYCVKKRAMLIVDCEQSDTFAKLQAGPNSLMTGANAVNAAFYFPWVNALDEVQNVTRPFPPSGFVAGNYAATDASRGVWTAPAGIAASLTGQMGLTVNLADIQSGLLNSKAVNCLRQFAQYGDVIWGARTMQGNDQDGSAWKYVPVRRLELYIEASLYEGTQWVAFEPNDAQLWTQIRLSVGAFMQSLFVQGAFQGATPQQAYFVKCDADNNAQSSIDDGIVNIIVGFAPLYPAEFVIFQIQQMSSRRDAASAPLSATSQRLDPYKNFRFRLKVGDATVAGFSEVGSLTRTTDVIDYREGSDSSVPIESPGRIKYEPISLKRGLTRDTGFYDWASGVWSDATAPGTQVLPDSDRKNIVLEVYNDAGQLTIAYKLSRCWVSEFQTLPELAADGNAITIEHLKLENDGWERDAGVVEPTPNKGVVTDVEPGGPNFRNVQVALPNSTGA
jgi:phage tail-like protein